MPVLHFVRFADYFVNCAALVAEPLAIMFQESFQSAILPSDWKSANIVPILEKVTKPIKMTIDQFLLLQYHVRSWNQLLRRV